MATARAKSCDGECADEVLGVEVPATGSVAFGPLTVEEALIA